MTISSTALPIKHIRPGLHLIEVPSPTIPPATTTNAWLLGDKNPIIVDPAAKSDLERHLLANTLENNPPSTIFLTHHHNDHIGSAVYLQNHFSIPIAAHRQTDELLKFSIDLLIEENDNFSTDTEEWTAIHTPGHAPGHLCLLSNLDQTMVAGDMVAGEGTILINPIEGSIREYISSLRRMKTYSPRQLLPAHGPILSNAIKTLDQYIAHRKMRLHQLKVTLQEGSMTELEIAKCIYTTLSERMLPAAAIQVHCGLIWLQEEGLVVREKAHWKLI